MTPKWHENYKPTGWPKPGTCPVCKVYTRKWTPCRVHERWECPKHPSNPNHGVLIPTE